MTGQVELIYSPFTKDVWTDVRDPIGVMMGMAIALNSRRPRRKPPSGYDQAIQAALTAVRAYTGIPELGKFGEAGVAVSEAFWLAKAAKTKLRPFIDIENFEIRDFGVAYSMYRANKSRAQLGTWSYVQDWLALLPTQLAFLASHAIEKAAASVWTQEIDAWHPVNGCVRFLQREFEFVVKYAVIPDPAATERAWRFCVAAGRLPRPGEDDELLEAFYAALSVGAPDFARDLVR